MPFSGNDLDRFNEFVHSLYVPQSEGTLRRTVADGLLKVIPGGNAGVSLFDLQTVTWARTNLAHPVNPDFLDSWDKHFMEHPMKEVLGDARHSSEAVLSDFISTNRWHRTSLYNETYRPERFSDQMSVEVGRPGPTLTGIGVFRERHGFSSQERRRMALLLPHFKQAFKNAAIFNQAIPMALAAQVHSDLTEGMILLNEQREILHCAESTRHLLDTFFPNVLKLPDRLPAELEARLHDPSLNSCKKVMGLRALEIYFYRDKASGRYLLTLRLLDSQADISQLIPLGLSPRESEVLYWIGQGKRDQEIAMILGLSIFTVKTHLKSIFRRLGVETRTAAAAAAIPFIHR